MSTIDDLELLLKYREDGDENVLLLDPLTAFRLAEAYRTDEHLREVLVITSAVRPIEEQRELYEAYKAGRGVLACLLYTSPSPRDRTRSRMPSSA